MQRRKTFRKKRWKGDLSLAKKISNRKWELLAHSRAQGGNEEGWTPDQKGKTQNGIIRLRKTEEEKGILQ